MKTSLAGFLLAALACSIGGAGCATATEEETATGDAAALTTSAGVELTTAVGAVVVDGKKVCTATLVDIDASAQIGGVSARGRQIVFGGACIGKLAGGVTGAAVFVSMQNGVSIATPIVAFDFESQAAAGLGVGILGRKVPGATPIEVIGTTALVNAGAHTASVIEANEDGVLIGSAVELHAGVAFKLKTQCSSFAFSAQAGFAGGAAVSLQDDGLGAAAFVRVNGKLRFAAHLDGGCVVRRIGDGLEHIADATLDAANDVGDFLSSIGTGDVIAVVNTKTRFTTFALRMTEHVNEIRINGQGRISAADSRGSRCDKLPFIVFGGPCTLISEGGYHPGELVTITVDTHAEFFPSGDEGQRLTVSTVR